jgi:23S rRNA (guanine745-N1)-methyltransferase
MEKCVRLLICPVCDGSLQKAGQTLRCSQAHTFDLSREGCVNLLSGRKRPKIAGDTKDMLRARRAFLERGYYDALSDAINQSVDAFLADAGHVDPAIVDVGCGEGYYLGRLQQRLNGVCCFGVDRSKGAAQMAARRYRDVCFVVADVKRKLPFAARSITILLNIFAPRNVVEFDRVMAGECKALVVIPTPRHLATVREEFGLLGVEPHKKRNVIAQFTPAFRLSDERIVEYDLSLTGDALRDLVQMTPSNWHLDEATRERLKTVDRFETKASVHILVLSR